MADGFYFVRHGKRGMNFTKFSKWIWIDEEQSADSYGEFYKEFEYTQGEETLCVSADSNYIVYINGQFVDSGQYPDFPHYKIYDTIDITNYCRQGVNRLAIVVWYYGIANLSYYPGNAALRFEVKNNGNTVAVSDKKTLSRKSVSYENGMQKNITWQLGLSFHYHAEREDFWKTECSSDFRESRIVEQELPLFPRSIKKLCISDRADSKLIKKSEHTHLFDLGREEVGYLTLKLSSKREQSLLICYGEHIVDGGVRRIIDERDFSVSVTVPAREVTYTNYFRRLGLRYLEIISEDELEIEYATVLPCFYPSKKKKKTFKNNLHQQIYDISVRTVELCMHDHYEDSPWREQGLYTMDSRNQMLIGYYAFEGYDYQRDNLYLMSHENRKDGLLSICTPTAVPLTIPSFSLHYITQVLEYVSYSNDINFAKQVLPKLESIARVFVSRLKNGLVPNFDGEEYFNFYEWTDDLSGQDVSAGSRTDAALNCLLSFALQNLAKICSLLNKENEYAKIANSLNAEIRKIFYDSKSGLFLNSLGTEKTSELVNSLAILCGVAQGKRAKRICDILTKERLLTPISLSMSCFKYDALLKVDSCRFKDFVLEDIESKYKRMLDAGATSFWETEKGEQDFDNAGSLCHGWSALPIYYFHTIL